MQFACPTCKATKGEPCKTDGEEVHPGRVQKLKRNKPKRRSVWTVSGGAFETNRRRH
jgi:hypothetical protein